jgi:hypothetical protein
MQVVRTGTATSVLLVAMGQNWYCHLRVASSNGTGARQRQSYWGGLGMHVPCRVVGQWTGGTPRMNCMAESAIV